jgi:cyclophilin family peptidyl-prolyl cis-trans isomerase
VSRDRRQEQRRQRNLQRQQQRREGRAPLGAAPLGAYEFPGIMGWMQRNAKWLFLGGIVVLVVSLGGGSLLSSNPIVTPTPTPTPSVTDTPTPTATPSGTPTSTPDPTIQRAYTRPPETVIDPTHTYDAIIRLEKGGEIRVRLDPKNAPVQTNNFVFLARNRFFDGLTFHRVLPGFVAQGGDPQGTGFGGPGYSLAPEKNSLKMDAGAISMAGSQGPNGQLQQLSGSQFFITFAPTPSLQSLGFSAFGQVTEGMDLLTQITPRDPSKPNQPAADVIKQIEIVEGS